ncbi:hypothetical protein BFG04_04410 [Campylobacter pinnipediorum subsp. pinnipediorum]|uniref:Uncharacterized protein n=1 Tax=Campylobacter pinnipediorum subsp. pinnipediorum TaxID=1660067 RepID=A0AAX0L9P2_9BACT|nr:hypothetical protein BFG04_04410 [Campylobacter pinnipediorum subsp. pinnipediorum]
MDWKFEYIQHKIDANAIREIAKLGDDELKLLLASLICEITSGIKYIPNKKAKVELAKMLIRKNTDKEKVFSLTGISKATYFKLKKGEMNG